MQLQWESTGETVREEEPWGSAGQAGNGWYSWEVAQKLLDDIDELSRRLSGERWARVAMTHGEDLGSGILGDWTGPFRTEFDTAYDEYMDLAEVFRVALRNLGELVIEHAEAVRAKQIELNEEAGMAPPAEPVTGTPTFCG